MEERSDLWLYLQRRGSPKSWGQFLANPGHPDVRLPLHLVVTPLWFSTCSSQLHRSEPTEHRRFSTVRGAPVHRKTPPPRGTSACPQSVTPTGRHDEERGILRCTARTAGTPTPRSSTPGSPRTAPRSADVAAARAATSGSRPWS